MVCGELGTENTISEQKILPHGRYKMNQKHAISKAHSSSLLRTRYPSVSIANRLRLAISSSFAATNFPNAIFFMFACSCLLTLNVVSCERNSYADSSKMHISSGHKDDIRNNYSATTPCPNCRLDREKLKNFTLEVIKGQILHRLGFTNGTPNISNLIKPSEIPTVKELFGNLYHHALRHESSQKYGGLPTFMQNDEGYRFDDAEDGLKTHTLLAMAKEAVIPGVSLPKRPLLFTFDSKSRNSIVHARLLLYQKTSVYAFSSYSRLVRVTVHKMTSKIASFVIGQFEHNLTADNKWVDFDLKDSLLKHFNEENEFSHLQVYLIITAKYVHSNISGDVPLVTELKKCDNERLDDNHSDCTNAPLLQLVIEEPKSRRTKRSTNTDCPSEQDNFNSCCRYPLEVDFEAFKWDFIIAPKKYQAHYCAGECTYLSQQKYPHTHLWTLATSKNGDKLSPCCGPRAMASIAMLYFNSNGNIVYGVLPGMVVERCGCQ